MNTRERRTKQEYALLVCAEFLRDELRFGALSSARYERKFTELRNLCFKALGDPSMKDVDDIRARYAELDEGVKNSFHPEMEGANGQRAR